MQSSTVSRPEEVLANLVHDLRQPLGNIETGVYLLTLVTQPEQTQTHTQLRIIERQVHDASRLLAEAGTALDRLRAQREEAGSFDLTNAATTGVT